MSLHKIRTLKQKFSNQYLNINDCEMANVLELFFLHTGFVGFFSRECRLRLFQNQHVY